MNRRNWLESMLGMFVGCQVPWIVRRPNELAIPQPQFVNPGFATRLTLADGEVIQGPGVAMLRPANVGTDLLMAPVSMCEHLDVSGLLVYYKGKLLSDTEFQGVINTRPKDTLHLSYNFRMTLNCKPLSLDDPQLVETLDRWRRGEVELNRDEYPDQTKIDYQDPPGWSKS